MQLRYILLKATGPFRCNVAQRGGFHSVGDVATGGNNTRCSL